MDRTELSAAFDDIFDDALVLHGYAPHLRDYDLYVDAWPGVGAAHRTTRHLRYRFTHCVRASATSAVPPEVWARSLDDRLLDRAVLDGPAEEITGYVWAVEWQCLYPGVTLLEPSQETARWESALGIPFHTARVGTNGHDLELVFSDLVVSTVEPGFTPYTTG